jgi:hypothetical protein
MKIITRLIKPAVAICTIISSTVYAADMTVYKSEYCGCCTEWAEQMEAAGFTLAVINSERMEQIKSQYGVPRNLQSCHTAMVDGYIVEGHVPASDIKRLISQKKNILGIATLGMPQSAPGMDVPGANDMYQVVAFNKTGMQYVYNEYNVK